MHTLADPLAHALRTTAEHTALICAGERESYAELLGLPA
jgi:hypothetical protein